MGVFLKKTKSDRGGGMQLNTKHGTNLIWMCDNCEEEDRCLALDIERKYSVNADTASHCNWNAHSLS